MSGNATVWARARASNSITNSIGQRERPAIFVQCSEGRLDVVLAFVTPLFAQIDIDGSDNTVELRIDDEPVTRTSWGSSRAMTELFYGGTFVNRTNERSAELVQRLIAGNTLHLRVYPPLHAAQYMTFSLAGSAPVLEPVLERCLPADG